MPSERALDCLKQQPGSGGGEDSPARRKGGRGYSQMSLRLPGHTAARHLLCRWEPRVLPASSSPNLLLDECIAHQTEDLITLNRHGVLQKPSTVIIRPAGHLWADMGLYLARCSTGDPFTSPHSALALCTAGATGQGQPISSGQGPGKHGGKHCIPSTASLRTRLLKVIRAFKYSYKQTYKGKVDGHCLSPTPGDEPPAPKEAASQHRARIASKSLTF